MISREDRRQEAGGSRRRQEAGGRKDIVDKLKSCSTNVWEGGDDIADQIGGFILSLSHSLSLSLTRGGVVSRGSRKQR